MGFISKKKPVQAGDESSHHSYVGPREKKASTGWTISVTRTRKDASDAQLQYA